MLDIKFITQNPDAVRETCKTRGYDVDVDAILSADQERREVLRRYEAVRQESKSLAKQWKQAEGADERRARAQQLKAEEAELAGQLRDMEEALSEKISWLPNFLDERVPVGGEEANIVVRSVGEQPTLEAPRSHEELGAGLDLIDIPRGVNAAKARFYCLKNAAVKMRYALIRMFTEHAESQGFQLVCPPFLARNRTLFASGYLPFAAKDNYKLENEDLSLIGTSEQAILGMHLDEMLSELPLLYLGDSMCFRTEAGSYGRDTAGILRVHQFYKLEQLVYCHPDESDKWHQACLENEEWLMQELEVPYQVVLTASGDMGAPGHIKYDTEAWFPSQNKYREMTSNTNITDYQTRRGNIRYKIGKEKGYPHTISATGFSDRLILAILENYQQADGSVRIPEKLVPYMNGQTSIVAK
ncbi:serine--tRNA ligase [Haliangium ochraceum]|uniref:Serine--tRNA ligase n=1 Tax=Haliangium ochraceum (strain DSM 14365 / JCM 11303 / SMP-2) TaxID=502025 RepID=D0LX96_HALO1|nr:serine--tRNA ligase [Haliangium ochraceum]ACY16138.1 seryl-tRNA synthetase [Haliangium ochraceum DSM 14365]